MTEKFENLTPTQEIIAPRISLSSEAVSGLCLSVVK